MSVELILSAQKNLIQMHKKSEFLWGYSYLELKLLYAKLTVCIFFQNMFYLFFKLLTKTFPHIQQPTQALVHKETSV